MASHLTHNAIQILINGDVDLRPVLQVLDIRQIGNAQSTQERFRLVLSDGMFTQQAMLATQLNDYVKNKEVIKGTIVRLVEYICNTVQNKKIIIVLNMEVVQVVADIIGNPQNLVSGAEQLPNGALPGGLARPPHHQQIQSSSAVAGKLVLQPQQSSYQASGNGWDSRQGIGGRVVETGGPVASAGYLNNENGVHSAYSAANGSSPLVQGQRQLGVNGGGGYSAGGGGLAHHDSANGRPLPPYQPPPMYSMKGPISRNEAPARIVPIAALNPYQGRWTIKARVTAKGDLRRYHNSKGDGKVFSFDCLDADGGEIRCTCFNNVADQFHDKVELGRVHMISKGSLKPSQKQYNHLKNEWEILLENASTVEPCMDEDNSIPQQVYEFKPISDVENMENNAMVDIVGVVLNIQDTVQIMRKNGTEALKRNLTITDQSGRSVELTMWGSFCNKEGAEIQHQISSGNFPIVAIKAGRVSDFSGKSIGTLNTSQILINPSIPEAHKLRVWHNQEGKNAVVASISKEGGPGGRSETRKFVSQIKDENLGRNEKPDWISVRATISFIKADNFCYTACPLKVGDKLCQKKVTNNGDGTWHCDRCDQSVPECDYRYLLNMQVQDHSGLTWITGFQDAGEEIFGISAKDLFMWKQADNPRFGDTVQRVLFSSHLFTLKVKEETFQDEPRVKSTITRSEKLNFATESKVLIESIRQLESGEVATQKTALNHSPSVAPSYGGAPTSNYGGSTYSNSCAANGQGDQNAGGFGGSTGGYGGYGSSNNTTKCFKCGKDGHFSNSCPNVQSRNDSYQGGAGGAGGAGGGCYKCGQLGHFAKDCPNQGGGRNFSRSGSGAGEGFGGSGYGGRGF